MSSFKKDFTDEDDKNIDNKELHGSEAEGLLNEEGNEFDNPVRPTSFDEYIGQTQLKENL